MATQALAPKSVSPLIRAARYTALITGIIYGHQRMKNLTAKEAVILEREDKIRERKAIRAKQLFAEQARQSLIDLAKETGVRPNDPEFRDLPELKDLKG